MKRILAYLFAIFLLVSCTHEENDHYLIIDLNRTTWDTLTLTSVLCEDSVSVSIAPNKLGAYVALTDTLKTGLYVAKWDSAHVMPLMLYANQPLKVCGTWQEWSAHRTTSSESKLLWQLEDLKRGLATARDSALTVRSRQSMADSVNTVRQNYRHISDSLLTEADGSLVSLAIVTNRDLFSPIHDLEKIIAVAKNLSAKHPRIERLKTIQSELANFYKLIAVRKRYSPGNDRPDFRLTYNETDTVAPSSYLFYKKRYAIAILPDSTTSVGKMTDILTSHINAEGRAVISKASNIHLPTKWYSKVGEFDELEYLDELRHFAPVLIFVTAEGKIERLYLGKDCIPQQKL